MEALHDCSPLEAGMDQAGPPSGDDAAPSPLDLREAGHRGWSGRAALQRRGPEAAIRAGVIRSAPEAAWQGAQLRAFVIGGGVAAQFARPSGGAAFEVPALGEALTVADDAVSALFGRDRAALPRVFGLPMQVKQQKEWELRNAQEQQMEAAGTRAPADF
jgi:hypothetical protein